MLQKLENAYLAILRFVIIAVAGVLLVSVVILGFNSFKAIQSEPVPEKVTPQVTDQEIIKAITEKPAAQARQSAKPKDDAPTADSNMPSYERAANAIFDFVSKYSGGTESVEKGQIIEITKAKAEALDDPSLTAAYAKGFADSIEKTLADPSVIKSAQSTSTLEVVNKALNIFTSKFNAQIKKAEIAHTEKQRQYLDKKAERMQSLYIAAGAFASFLMIVFLSVIIRIERNLRHLENKALPQA